METYSDAIVENKYIIIHNTADAKELTFDEAEKIYTKQHWNFPYHYLIAKNGERKKFKEIDKNAGSTNNNRYNQRAVQIALIGNFNNEEPTEAQYKTLNYLIAEIEKKHWIQIKIWHNEIPWAKTSCPWANFDKQMLIPIEQRSGAVWFSLSRYYSPEPNQNRYYGGKTYEQDKEMNCWPWDCLVPADWGKLTDKDIYKSIACPKEYPLGTKIYLDWMWVVTCRDRGGAIKDNRLDVRCGAGISALDNRDSCPTWSRRWYVID